MKAAALLFFSLAIYLLGAIASAVAAPYQVAGAAMSASPDLTYALIQGVQAAGSLAFLTLAVIQLVADVVKRERDRAQG